MSKPPRLFGRVGLARFLGLSEARITQIDPPADAFVDGRPAWSLQTATRMKVERETRLAERQATRDRRKRMNRPSQAGDQAA